MSSLLKKIVASLTTLACAAMMMGFVVTPAQALTAAELQAQIDLLMAQITALNAQIAALSGGTTGTITGCTITSFDRTLSQGMTGDDVKCLQIILNTATDTQVATSGAGSPGSETTYFGPLTKAAVVKFQVKYTSEILATYGLTAGTGLVGPTTRAKLNSLLTGGLPSGCTCTDWTNGACGGTCLATQRGQTRTCTGTCTGTATTQCVTDTSCAVATGLTVSLASDTPAAATLVAGSAYNVFTKVKLIASADGAVSITGVAITRTGFSNDNDVAGVMVMDSAGRRHGNVVTFSESKATISFVSNPITVAAGATDYLTIQVNLDATNATSGTIALGIASNADVTTTSSVTGAPATGNLMGMTAATGILGSLTVDEVLISATARNVDLGVTNQEIGKFRFTSANSNEDINIKSVSLYNNGTSSDGDITNIDLVAPDGTVLATVTQTTDDYVTFDLSASPYLLKKGTNKIFTIRADVTSGSARTSQFLIQNDYDVVAVGVSTAAGILVTATGTVDTAGFPVGDNTATDNTITAAAGTLTVSRDSTSPSGEVGVGASDVVLGIWKLQANGEDMELRKVDVDLAESAASGVAADVNGTLKVKVDGSTIWSYDATSATVIWDGLTDQATLSSYVTIPANSSKLLTVVVDVSTAATNGHVLQASLANLYYKKMSTNAYATAQPSTTAWSRGNSLSISSASLTATKNTGVPNSAGIKGAANLLVGSFSLQAGAAETININTVNIDLNAAAGLTNLRLKDSTGTQIGSTIAAPSATTGANTFSVSGLLNLSASSTKVLNVYVDTATTTGATIVTSLPASAISGTGASSGNTITAPTVAVTGQTITMTTAGTLTVTLNSTTTPAAAVYHAAETAVGLGDINFASGVQENITLNKMDVIVMNGDANYSDISLWDGTTQVGSTTNLINGVASFTGLSKLVEKDATVTLRVKAKTNVSGALKSQLKTKVGVRYVEATGNDSGTILKPGVSSIDGAATTGVTDRYELGEVVVFAEATNNETALAIDTVIGTGTTAAFDYSTTANRAANTVGQTTDRVVRFPFISTEIATAATGVQYSYIVGDVVLFHDTTNTLNFVGHIAATTPTITYYDDAGNAAMAATAIVSGDYIAKLFTGGTMDTVGTTTAQAYTAGQPVYFYDASTSSNLAVVSTAGASTTAVIASASKGQTVATPAAGDVIITVPYIWKESPVSANATNYSYTIGDVVLYYDVSATHTYLAVVTAAPTATTPTFTADGDNVSIATTGYATGDYIVKLYSAGAVGKRMTIHDGEPTVSTKTSIPGSYSATQDVAEFSIKAEGREINITSVDLAKNGNNLPWKNVTNFKLYNGTSPLAETNTFALATATDANSTTTLSAIGTTINLCGTSADVTATTEIDMAASGPENLATLIKAGDRITFRVSDTNYVTFTVTAIATGAAKCGGADTTDVRLTVLASPTRVGAEIDLTASTTTIYSNNVHFDSNSTVTALSSQTISKDATLVLTVKADTNGVGTGLAAGASATFSVTLSGIASQDPAATETYGLTWGYTPSGGTAITGLQICDSYPLSGPTFSYGGT